MTPHGPAMGDNARPSSYATALPIGRDWPSTAVTRRLIRTVCCMAPLVGGAASGRRGWVGVVAAGRPGIRD